MTINLNLFHLCKGRNTAKKRRYKNENGQIPPCTRAARTMKSQLQNHSITPTTRLNWENLEHVFAVYLQASTNFCPENVQFLFDFEEAKLKISQLNDTNKHEMSYKLLTDIANTYISPNGRSALNIPDDLKEDAQTKLDIYQKKPSAEQYQVLIGAFSAVVEEIKSLIENDTFRQVKENLSKGKTLQFKPINEDALSISPPATETPVLFNSPTPTPVANFRSITPMRSKTPEEKSKAFIIASHFNNDPEKIHASKTFNQESIYQPLNAKITALSDKIKSKQHKRFPGLHAKNIQIKLVKISILEDMLQIAKDHENDHILIDLNSIYNIVREQYKAKGELKLFQQAVGETKASTFVQSNLHLLLNQCITDSQEALRPILDCTEAAQPNFKN